MKNILILIRKDLISYFVSPIAYVVIAVFLVLSGIIFSLRFSFFYHDSLELSRNPYMMGEYNLNVTEHVLEPMFFTLNFLSLLIVPMLTMRAFAEDKKSGTMELLFTYPVRDIEVGLSKFAACFIVYCCMIGLTLLYPALSARYADPEWGSVAMGYAGLLLSGAAFVALGVFVSSLTENQIIAVAVSYGLLLLFWLFGAAETLLPQPYNVIVTDLSLFNHLEDFARGVLDTHDLVYYVSFTALAMFFTLRSLEVTKWKGKA
ncbi:MAG: ABC transporter permease [Candidatus Abyssobacteria bacterium SURF_17]|uniref:ABC transporter permease n=1 Tax=Candidatus Abyssobacteria bacterium SURF_17 TaxID=2093361 RepID=A0A419EU35_9BACT|nr:MAG: ABC transporter permease [Candidatus Abyssubacteria bacterium SURF_17]